MSPTACVHWAKIFRYRVALNKKGLFWGKQQPILRLQQAMPSLIATLLQCRIPWFGTKRAFRPAACFHNTIVQQCTEMATPSVSASTSYYHQIILPLGLPFHFEDNLFGMWLFSTNLWGRYLRTINITPRRALQCWVHHRPMSDLRSADLQ